MPFCKRVRSAKDVRFAAYLNHFLIDFKKEHDGIDLVSELDPELKRTRWPHNTFALLALIVCELIDNAVEALKGKGKIQLSVDLLPSKECLLIKVRDNGPGVAKDSESMIFKEHFSTRGSGRGLGLHLIKEGILKLNGSIEYSFEDGAAFKALIPLPQGRGRSVILSAAKWFTGRSLKKNDSNKPIRIVVSYSHQDEALRGRLDANLKLLQNQGFVIIWNDRRIMPGDRWENAIEEELKAADVILLLISADFLASDYCQKIEVPIALRRSSHSDPPALKLPRLWHMRANAAEMAFLLFSECHPPVP